VAEIDCAASGLGWSRASVRPYVCAGPCWVPGGACQSVETRHREVRRARRVHCSIDWHVISDHVISGYKLFEVGKSEAALVD